jgi:hypothetical protein
MDTFLTEEELRHITGRRRYSAQIRALTHMGIGHVVRPDGRPIVTRRSLEISLSGSAYDRTAEPDFSSLINGTVRP